MVADVENNIIEIDLSPQGVSGRLTLTLKGLEGAEKEVYSGIVAGGTFTQSFHLEKFTAGDGEMTLTSVEAEWEPGSAAALPRLTSTRKRTAASSLKSKQPMNPRIELGFWTITKYFTPVLSAYAGMQPTRMVGTGTYDDKTQQWSGLHDVEYPDAFLHSARLDVEGFGMIGDTKVRFFPAGNNATATQFHGWYLSDPDPDQQTGSCAPEHNILGTTDTCASRSKNLRCGARVMIDGISGIKVKRDSGNLHGNNRQIDVYLGEGGPELDNIANQWGGESGGQSRRVVELLKAKGRS